MKTVDLFAGCGGLSLGFQNAGFDIIAAYENWEIAVNNYKANFRHPVYRKDLSDYTEVSKEIQALSPDLIIGGPPCQDFSHAGKRIEADRANLTESYAKIISLVRPKYFVMENVDRAQTSNAFKNAESIFKSNGYGLTKIILDASKCGVPQKRKRFFCIGALGEQDDFLKDLLLSKQSNHEMTLRDYFGDTLGFQYYYRHPRNYSRRAIFSIDEPAPTIRGVNRPVPKGYPGHPNDACKLSDDVRSLTTLERSLIQTFPSTYKWSGSKTDMEQMIGNAVPVKLAEYVAISLSEYLQSSASVTNNIESFQKWLILNYDYSPRTIKDTVSRLKRANSLFEYSKSSGEDYLTLLQKQQSFNSLSVSVKSQIKRAVGLYTQFVANQ